MDVARISVLLEPFLEAPLTSTQLAETSTYIDLLLRWNARINLTAVRDPEQIVPRHFGESLFLARHLFPGAELRSEIRPPENAAAGKEMQPRILDIGSGAGFPGLPLRIWAPHIHLTLVESNHKKAAFLREVTRSLTLTDVDVVNERAESLLARHKDGGLGVDSDYKSYTEADIVTFRAVERFDNVLPTAVSLVRPGGKIALLIGAAQLGTMTALTPTVQWTPAMAIPQSSARVLSIGVRTP